MFFYKVVVYYSNYLHIYWQDVISGQISERQFLKNSSDGFLEQLVPQYGRKKKKEAFLDLSLNNTVTWFKKYILFYHEVVMIKSNEFQYF